MSVVPFKLDHAQRFMILGRDDATLLYQSGLSVGIVAMGVDGRPYSTEVPIYRLQLAFGKRASGQGPQPALTREEAIGDALQRMADAMAGNYGPCDSEPAA